MDLYTVRKQLNMGMPLTSIKLRVTDYARVSTDTQEQKKSLKNQVEHFEQYIATTIAGEDDYKICDLIKE